MEVVVIDLGEGVSEAEVRERLAERVEHTIDAVAGPETVVYGDVSGATVWLGLTRPGRRRLTQRLFRGVLDREDGRWRLLGRMELPADDLVRLAFLVVIPVVLVGMRVPGWVGEQGFSSSDPIFLAVAAILGLLAFVYHQVGVSQARVELEEIRARLEPQHETHPAS